MAIAFVNSTTATQALEIDSLLTITSASTNTDHLLLLIVGVGDFASSSFTGWTLLAENAVTYHRVYWRWSDGSATYDVPVDSGSDCIAGMVAYSGVDNTTPIAADAESVANDGDSPSVTATGDGLLVCLISGTSEAPWSFGQPLGMTERVDATFNDMIGVGIADEAISSGPTGTKSWTVLGPTLELKSSVALNESTGGGGGEEEVVIAPTRRSPNSKRIITGLI